MFCKKYANNMNIKNKIEEILMTDYQYVDCYTVDKILGLFTVSGRSEQLPTDVEIGKMVSDLANIVNNEGREI